MTARARWGITIPNKGWDWEEDRLGRVRQYEPQAPENAQAREVILYGPKGEPLVVKEPRRVGFHKP